MRVLWLTKSPSGYASRSGDYNGYGWVSSLERQISSTVTLAVSFVSNDACGPAVKDGVQYFPVPDPYDSGRTSRIRRLFSGNAAQRSWILTSFVKIIKEFRPDVIEVFGSEYPYGLVAEYVDIPVVLHVQGILDACVKGFLPPGMSLFRYCLSGRTLRGIAGKYYHWLNMKRRAADEAEVLKTVHFFIGRTAWDREVVKTCNADASYFKVNEVLRPPFYKMAGTWSPSDRMKIVSTISEAPYKGMDLILRTASLLRSRYGLRFEWKVFGNVDLSFYENFTGVNAEDCGVMAAGVGGAEDIASELVSASVYVHPSYVDNSPNSVCEAQMIGVPVVAAAVGGVPSLVEDGVTGLLAAPGNAEDFAEKIRSLIVDADRAATIAGRGAAEAASRHDVRRIREDMFYVYSQLSPICH